jgi:hypothetical protein
MTWLPHRALSVQTGPGPEFDGRLDAIPWPQVRERLAVTAVQYRRVAYATLVALTLT